MKWLFTPFIASVLGACIDESIRDCDGIEQQVVWMEKGLLKITGAEVTSRTARELVCHGTAIYKDGDEIRMRYRVYRDEDGDEMIAYDTDEAQQALEEAEKREVSREIEAVVNEMTADFDQHMRDNMSPGAWERIQQRAGAQKY
ncbi:MAG: hypothetical protein ABW169_16640 [Sphingobium sp.]